MEIIKILPPDGEKICREAFRLWTDVFGPYSDRDLLVLQGAEAQYNREVLYAAIEKGRLLGTCRSTTPLKTPWVSGVGEVCTAPEARGRGLSHLLMRAMLADFSDTTAFLGTENPIAAKLYSRHGFQFITGSNVMIRSEKSYRDFTDSYFSGGGFHIVAGDPSLRIPSIPVCLFRGCGTVMDINAGIVSTELMTQRSCMGIYPKFEDVQTSGGIWLAGLNDKGNMCASATAFPMKEGWRLDAFAHPDSMAYLPTLVAELQHRTGENNFVCVSSCDVQKRGMFENMGYRRAGEELHPVNGVYMIFTVLKSTRELCSCR